MLRFKGIENWFLCVCVINGGGGGGGGIQRPFIDLGYRKTLAITNFKPWTTDFFLSKAHTTRPTVIPGLFF